MKIRKVDFFAILLILQVLNIIDMELILADWKKMEKFLDESHLIDKLQTISSAILLVKYLFDEHNHDVDR